MSVLAVTPQGGARDFRAATVPASKPAEKPEALDDLSAVAWTDADIARFLDRRDRLLHWGWPAADAETLAQRLVMRDRAADDERASCTECRHYASGCCSNHLRAGLNSAELGRDMAAMLQRCPGFQSSR